MTLTELRNKARAAAKRVEDRLNAAIGDGRELTTEEEASSVADEAELAGLNAEISAAEAAATAAAADTENSATIANAATDGERTRVLALVDLCAVSSVSASLRAAIEGGQDAGAFAITLARDAKTRGASMADLRAGAVQPGQLPTGTGAGAGKPGAAKTDAERAKGILAFAAQAGHAAARHLKIG